MNAEYRAWDLERIWGAAVAAAEPGIALRPFGLASAAVCEDALPPLRHWLAAHTLPAPTLIADETPKLRDGQHVVELLTTALGAARVLHLPAGIDASQANARGLAREVEGAGLLVSVGSGAVTDLAKAARDAAAPDAVLVAWPTAASVTAYSSALTVLTIDRVKRTIPSRAPDAVFCDLPTLCAAPPVMTKAGFGDVLARAVSYGDWWLASSCGLDEGFSAVPMAVMGDGYETMVSQAAEVARLSPSGVAAVMEGLLLAGLAMSVVNQTAPLSGWEHVISHWLDMTAPAWNREHALHGEQVGVATLVSARAYERLLTRLDGARVADDIAASLAARWRAIIEERLNRVDSSGAMAREAWSDVQAKLRAWDQAGPARRQFAALVGCGELPTRLQDLARGRPEVEGALRTAACPTGFDHLSQPVSEAAAIEALLCAHLVRRRMTLGDLLTIGGLLDAETALDLLN